MDWLWNGLAVVGVLLTALGAWFGWRTWRKRKPETTNAAISSKRVRQSGGTGKTQNHAQNSEDVDQSG